MHRFAKVALAALPIAWAAGCSDWLSGPKLDTNPNSPSSATPNVLLTGIQAQQNININGDLARTASIFTQQMGGTLMQYLTLGRYNMTENDFYQVWPGFFGQGGLLDIRKVEDMSRARSDSVYLGIAQVWEAIDMSTAADVWGDVPYSEAVTANPTPKLDSQQEVYAHLQALLDTAITDLQGQGTGPEDVDLIYGGDAQKWIEAAHTLKARLWLHVAEVEGQSAYANALAQAQQGISTPANDFVFFASTAPGEQNLWYQFERDRSGYVRAGLTLVDLLKSRNDPRLTQYFSPAPDDSIGGAAAGQKLDDKTQSWLSATRGAPGFEQPYMTWAENQLIIAEAAYQTGDEATALAALDAERRAAGLPDEPASLTGPALLTEIMTEKYIALFQNPESWNDWKRTCIPNLTGYNGEKIPRRLYYSVDERNANPNIPAPGTGANGARNWNDPSDPAGCNG